MAALKYNDVIKKSRDLDCYFGVFQKILCSITLMQNFIAIAYKWYIIRYIHSNFFYGDYSIIQYSEETVGFSIF